MFVLNQKLSEVDGPLKNQVDTLGFFLSATLKGKSDQQIAESLQMVIATLQEALDTPLLATSAESVDEQR